MKKRLSLCAAVVLCVLCCCHASTVFGYSSLVSFGDSLSDTGNVGRYTDGDVWVELLAGSLGVPLYNNAYAGATTGYDNPAGGMDVTGLRWQVEEFTNGFDLSKGNSLITLWAGANDFLQNRDEKTANSNISSALEELYDEGGREFVVLNLPNIGSTPQVLGYGEEVATVASEWTAQFNTGLENMVGGFSLSHADANLYFIDIYSIFDAIPVGSEQWSSMFWGDGFHPSAAGHRVIADAVLAETPVPEPATAILFGCGTLLLGLWLRQKNTSVS